MQKQNVTPLVKQNKSLSPLSLTTFGLVPLALSATTKAQITGAQITSAYGDSGASDISDTVGLIVIGVCAAIMAIGIGIRLFRKG